jgi:DNA-binding NtrC family response regulator
MQKMLDSTILTVSSNQEFVSVLRLQLQDQVGGGSRMIVAGTVEEACSLLDTAGPRVVVVHYTGEIASYDQLDGLLWATSVQARRIPVLVIADRYRTDQATMLFRMGVSEYISRSHHLSQFGEIFAAYLPGMAAVAEHAIADSDRVGQPVKTRTLSQVSQSVVSQVV